jgi:4-deoxy-L-threo-5-hexosulose-uronate ketol-isomerase
MKTNYELRYAAHPEDAKQYDTKRIRRDFLIEKVFTPNEVNMVYSMYDRMIVGGAMPAGGTGSGSNRSVESSFLSDST